LELEIGWWVVMVIHPVHFALVLPRFASSTSSMYFLILFLEQNQFDFVALHDVVAKAL
jgi:hypothetical protein